LLHDGQIQSIEIAFHLSRLRFPVAKCPVSPSCPHGRTMISLLSVLKLQIKVSLWFACYSQGAASRSCRERQHRLIVSLVVPFSKTGSLAAMKNFARRAICDGASHKSQSGVMMPRKAARLRRECTGSWSQYSCSGIWSPIDLEISVLWIRSTRASENAAQNAVIAV
jgi:hypothetical protein